MGVCKMEIVGQRKFPEDSWEDFRLGEWPDKVADKISVEQRDAFKASVEEHLATKPDQSFTSWFCCSTMCCMIPVGVIGLTLFYASPCRDDGETFKVRGSEECHREIGVWPLYLVGFGIVGCATLGFCDIFLRLGCNNGICGRNERKMNAFWSKLTELLGKHSSETPGVEFELQMHVYTTAKGGKFPVHSIEVTLIKDIEEAPAEDSGGVIDLPGCTPD